MMETSFLTEYVTSWICMYTVNHGYYMNTEHIHYHHEFSFNFSPIPIRHTFNGKIHETSMPYIAYRAPYTLHSSTTMTEEKYERYRLDINPYLFTLYGGVISLGNLKNVNECIIPMNDFQMDHLKPLLEMLSQKFTKNYIGALDKSCIGLLAVLLDETSKFSENAIVKNMYTLTYIQDVLYYIIENISEHLTYESFAKVFFVSESKIRHDFQSVTNLSLHEYISAVRISLAKLWLQENEKVSIIAERCGFSQASSFIVMFKRMTGMTPEQYRSLTGRNGTEQGIYLP